MTMEGKPIGQSAQAEAPWTDRFLAGDRVPYEAGLIDIERVRGFLWRQRAILIGITLFALVAGLAATLLTTPIFQATSSVRIDPEQPDIFEGASLAPTIQLNTLDSYIATLAKVIESRTLATQVAESLDPNTRGAFLGNAPPARPQGLTDEQWIRRQAEMAAPVLAGATKAEAPLNERVIYISHSSSDPALAARIANAYADNFLTEDLRRSVAKNAYARNYLEKEITDVRARLDEAQRQALGYARANDIVGDSLLPASQDAAAAVPQTITASALANVTQTVAAARAKRIEAEQRWRAVAGASVTSTPEYQQSPSAQALLGERSRVAAELAEQEVRYGADYPAVRELKAQLGSIDRQLGAIGNSIKSTLRKEYEVALRQEQALSGELRRVSNETLDEQDRRVAFNQLNAQAEALQTQLTALLQRYNQISASANVQPSTVTLLDEAVVPTSPVSPNLLKNLLAALVLGGGAALGLAVLRETLDDRLRSPDDVELKLSIPTLGLTPLVAEGDIEDSSVLAEAYSSIRVAIDFALATRNHNVIQFTSSQSVEGKTTTSIAIAREYARLGRKVLLVDGDLRRPSIAAAFGQARGKKGFTEVLAGEATLEEALLRQDQANLSVLPVGAIPANPVEVVASRRFDDFIARVRPDYDLIVIDSPPIMGLADAPLMSRVADGVVFVVESNRAHFGQAKTALRRLRDARARVLGAVLTKYRALEAGQSYSYQYSYYAYGGEDRDGRRS